MFLFYLDLYHLQVINIKLFHYFHHPFFRLDDLFVLPSSYVESETQKNLSFDRFIYQTQKSSEQIPQWSW